MVGGLKFNPRPQWVGLKMNVRLQVQGVGVSREFVTKPPKVGRLIEAIRRVKQFLIAFEVLPTERHPNSVREGLIAPVDRDLEKPTNKEVLVVNDARVRRELGRPALVVRHGVILEGGVKGKIGKATVDLAASRALERELVFHALEHAA